MKKIVLLIMSGLLVLDAGAQEYSGPLKLTLEDCLNYAYDNNYNRQSIKLNETAKEDLYTQSKIERAPAVNASLGETLSHTNGESASWNGNYNLNANVTLFQGGNINQTIKQNELILKQAGYQTEQYDNELTIQVLQSFLTALGNEELLRYQQAVFKASEEQVKQGAERYAVGEILESDYLLLEAQYATDKNNITQTTISRDNSLLALKSLLSIDASVDVEIVYPDTSAVSQLKIIPPENYVVETAMENLPDMQISNYNVEIAETGLKISKSSFYPTLTMNGSVGTGHVQNFQNYGNQLSDKLNEQVGITLSIPIFNRNKVRSGVTQSKIALQQAELDKMQTELELKQTVIQEYRNVIAAGSKYDASDIKQNAYKKSFEAYRAKYEAGAITTVDLLQQQNNYISALNDYIQDKYGFMLKRKILDVYMGIPITM